MQRTDTGRRTDTSTAQNCKTDPPVRLNTVSQLMDHFFLEAVLVVFQKDEMVAQAFECRDITFSPGRATAFCTMGSRKKVPSIRVESLEMNKWGSPPSSRLLLA